MTDPKQNPNPRADAVLLNSTDSLYNLITIINATYVGRYAFVDSCMIQAVGYEPGGDELFRAQMNGKQAHC